MIEGEDSDEDIVTEYTRMEEDIQISNETPSVPTISVTPHSPASITTGRQYSVLEDNLCQLRNIVEAVQQMKDANLGALSVINQPCARLSCSCPSLNDQLIDSDLLPGCVTAWSSTNTNSAANSTYRSQRNSGDWWNGVTSGSSMIDGEMLRRRSWAALEDLTVHSKRQSISVSSAESDIDDPFLDSTTNLLKVTDGVSASITRRCKSSACDSRHNNVISNTSTHSLNEADLKSDFMKVRAKREAQERLLQARIPLQKSISTPSMLAVRELFCQSSHVPHASSSSVATSNNAAVSVTDCLLMSETDEDTLSSHNMNYALLNHFLQQEEEGQKRRKRGSLFFRKKKDKNVKKTTGTHAWVASIASTAVTCDCCSKPIGNKQTLHCDNCFITVHRNGCSEQVADCCKSKSSKTHGSVVQIKANYAVKRGTSGPMIQPQCNSTFANAPTDEKDDLYHKQELSFYGDEYNSMPLEFLDEAHISAADLDTDAFLGLQDDEPDTWTPNVTKDILRKLTDKEIKRQEHIYEFILTEKHHCLTLLVMQKIFVDGLDKYFNFGSNVQRMFPRLSQLTNIHLKFLHNLRQRQKAKPVVDTIGDVLLKQFSDENAQQLKDAYGEFCSRHRDAVDIYKFYLQQNTRFAQFVKYSQSNPLLKKKGIPECILFVTQRLTKYPLLIEPLIKTSKDNKTELETLSKALALVKEILVDVDACVAEKEKHDRKLEIYNKLDAKSFAIYKDDKFKKSHILSNNRCLRFEGEAMLMQGRGKMQLVHVVVLSDVLFFLLENSNEKFVFFTPDNKTGVISLQKVLVREKAGTDCRGLYLISSNPCDPEMYELKIHKPKDKQVWIKCIREAVQNCPEEDEIINNGQWVTTAEDREKQLEMKQIQIQEIVEVLRQKDVEQAMILEEKIRLQLRLLAAGGVGIDMQVPSYSNLVCQQLDNDTIRQQVINTVQKVNELTSSFYGSSSNLSRSASSVGERQSNTYVSPALPKRAETFGGFDNSILSPKGLALGLGRKLSQQLSWKRGGATNEALTSSASNSPVSTPELTLRKCASLKAAEQEGKDEDAKPSLLQLEREQQSTTLQLTNLVYTLASIVAQQITSIDSLQAQLAVCKQELGRYVKDVTPPGKKDSKKPMYRHNQQLEELRNLQDKLTQEKETWQREKESQERDLQEKRDNLLRLQEQIKKDQDDVTQQREQLYRKLEMLTTNNSNNSSNNNNSNNSEISTPVQIDTIRRQSESMRWKQGNKIPSPNLPVNLISTTNQQKVPCTVPIKQKLPLKLASKLASAGETTTPSTTGSGGVQQLLPLKLRESNINNPGSNSTLEGRRSIGIYHKIATNPTGLTPSHSRTGSSPAMMQNTQVELMSQTKETNKAERTNTYPKIPDKFKLQSEGKKKDNDGCEEQEVIFF